MSSSIQLPAEVPQPEGSPLRELFNVPRDYVERFAAIDLRASKGQETPLTRFAAAAVLHDSDNALSDSEVVSLARGLAAAHGYIEEHPGELVLAVSSSIYLQAGRITTGPERGLYFKNSTVGKPFGVVACSSSLEADIDTNNSPMVKLADRTDGTGRQTPVEFLTPRYVLTPDNMDGLKKASGSFLKDSVLIAGTEAVKAFFDELTSKQPKSKPAAQRKQVAEEAVRLLAGSGAE